MSPKLIAYKLEDYDAEHRKWPLEDGLDMKLGRRVPTDQLLVDWDPHIAPRHATVRLQGTRLFVGRIVEDTEEQPIFYRGEERDSFEIIPGEGFVISNTAFRFAPLAATGNETDSQSEARRVSAPQATRSLEFHPTEDQVEAIRNLLQKFEKMKLDEFARHVETAIHEAIPGADEIRLLTVLGGEGEKRIQEFGTSDPAHSICDDLVFEACTEDDFKAQVFNAKQPRLRPSTGMKWAACMPVVSNKGDDEGELAIYLAGKRTRQVEGAEKWNVTNDQQVFLQIVARILSGVRTLDDLRRYRRWMQEFLPKPIRNLIYRKGPEDVFRSEQVQVSVLFCDLRGSCRFAEEGREELKKSWNQLQAALAVMTQAITDRGGTIGDFQGDAAMGFWGWPTPDGATRDPKQSVRDACNAADTLRERFTQKEQADPGLRGMKCGIGVATGPAWAGMLGTQDQRKLSVFGPVVNLAARLETLTKQFDVSILLDEETRQLLAEADKNLIQQTRYLAKIVPAGMQRPVKVFELMLPAAQLVLEQTEIRRFKEGRDALFDKRDWALARRFLEPLRDRDGPSRFLLTHMQDRKQPPDDWDGVFHLSMK